MEELTWSNAEKNARHARGTAALTRLSMDANSNGDVSDLMNSYQQKIAVLNEEILQLKQDVQSRDQDICQLHVQCKILKQRSRSVERAANSSNDDRLRRGISVDAGGNLREQLDTSFEETRALKAKLSKLEDELNSSALVRIAATPDACRTNRSCLGKTNSLGQTRRTREQGRR